MPHQTPALDIDRKTKDLSTQRPCSTKPYLTSTPVFFVRLPERGEEPKSHIRRRTSAWLPADAGGFKLPHHHRCRLGSSVDQPSLTCSQLVANSRATGCAQLSTRTSHRRDWRCERRRTANRFMIEPLRGDIGRERERERPTTKMREATRRRAAGSHTSSWRYSRNVEEVLSCQCHVRRHHRTESESDIGDGGRNQVHAWTIDKGWKRWLLMEATDHGIIARLLELNTPFF